METDDRGARERANLARHLNASYPDTLLLLAQALGGTPAALSATILRLEPDRVVLTVQPDQSGGRPREVVLPLSDDDAVPLRQRVSALVLQARDAAPDAPQTSLERMLGGGDHDRTRSGGQGSST